MGSWINETKIRCPLCGEFLYEHGVDTGGSIEWLACHNCGIYNGHSAVHSYGNFSYKKEFTVQDVESYVRSEIQEINALIRREKEDFSKNLKHLSGKKKVLQKELRLFKKRRG